MLVSQIITALPATFGAANIVSFDLKRRVFANFELKVTCIPLKRLPVEALDLG